MRRMFRTVILILVLTFAAGTVVHTAQAPSMAVAMQAAAMAGGAMPDCDGCGGKDEGADAMTCSPACVAPAIAVLGFDTHVLAEIALRPVIPPAQQIAGHPALVDPHPPRRHVLI